MRSQSMHRRWLYRLAGHTGLAGHSRLHRLAGDRWRLHLRAMKCRGLHCLPWLHPRRVLHRLPWLRKRGLAWHRRDGWDRRGRLPSSKLRRNWRLPRGVWQRYRLKRQPTIVAEALVYIERGPAARAGASGHLRHGIFLFNDNNLVNILTIQNVIFQTGLSFVCS